MVDDGLVAHLPLDEIRVDPGSTLSSTPNTADSAASVRVLGQPAVVLDPEMGTCLQFDGSDDHLELPTVGLDLSRGMTVAAWVKLADATSSNPVLALSGPGANDRIGLGTEASTGDLVAYRVSGGIAYGLTHLRSDTWHHVVVTTDAERKIRIYVDGTGGLIGESRSLAGIGWTSALVGTTADSVAHFRGAMAHLRLYARAISPAEIDSIMRRDKDNLASYRETALLGVELYTVRDDDHTPVLFIEADNRSEPLEVALTNPSEKPIVFVAAGDPSETDFHVQLRFRRNVVAPSILDRLRTAQPREIDGWRFAIGISPDGSEDYISFTRRETPTFALGKGETRRIRLPEFSAAARGGARNTRIEVRFRTEPQNPGSVIRHMEIQSHLGLQTIPLIAQVKGSNTVLNDGESPNELTLEVRTATRSGTVALQSGTRFELLVDDELGSTLEATASVPAPTDTTRPAGVLDDQPRRTGQDGTAFVFVVEGGGITLSEGRALTIQITGWITGAPTGAHNLLIRYENVPGYWDGTWVLPVQFSPLVIRGGKVGIGTDELSEEPPEKQSDEPPAMLNVAGRVRDKTGALMPVGAILAYGGAKAPPGWLICDGETTLDPTTHGDLITVLGLGAAKVKKVPNLRKRFVVGALPTDDETDPYRRHGTGGEDTHTLSVDEMPVHTHTASTAFDGLHGHTNQRNHRADNDDNDHWGNYIGVNGFDNGDYRRNENRVDVSPDGSAHSHRVTVDAAGRDRAHNNLPPYYALTYIIKY